MFSIVTPRYDRSRAPIEAQKMAKNKEIKKIEKYALSPIFGPPHTPKMHFLANKKKATNVGGKIHENTKIFGKGPPSIP